MASHQAGRTEDRILHSNNAYTIGLQKLFLVFETSRISTRTIARAKQEIMALPNAKVVSKLSPVCMKKITEIFNAARIDTKKETAKHNAHNTATVLKFPTKVRILKKRR